jgi:hypothetical protein
MDAAAIEALSASPWMIARRPLRPARVDVGQRKRVDEEQAGPAGQALEGAEHGLARRLDEADGVDLVAACAADAAGGGLADAFGQRLALL